MGQVQHRSATTTAAVRRAVQHSQESLRAKSSLYGLKQKSVTKWRRRSTIDNLPIGQRQARFTALSVEDEAIVVVFRWHTLLPLDDCLYASQATIPHLTRSSLLRCLLPHDISRVPEVKCTTPIQRKIKAYSLGCVHIDIAEVNTAVGSLNLLIATDCTTMFTFVELHEKATRSIAGDFLRALIKAMPYRIHTVLTDNGTHFTSPGNVRSAAAKIWRSMGDHEQARAHAFE